MARFSLAASSDPRYWARLRMMSTDQHAIPHCRCLPVRHPSALGETAGRGSVHLRWQHDFASSHSVCRRLPSLPEFWAPTVVCRELHDVCRLSATIPGRAMTSACYTPQGIFIGKRTPCSRVLASVIGEPCGCLGFNRRPLNDRCRTAVRACVDRMEGSLRGDARASNRHRTVYRCVLPG